MKCAGENVGMDDTNTGGHEADRGTAPLVGCTEMGVFEDFSNKK